jgi:molybdopterin adenylyltransferase
VTPEATAEVIERPTPGLDEAMREVSRRASAHGMLSRGRSGIVGRTLIVNFPGSPKACAECFDAVAPALGHGVKLLLEEPTEHPA